MADFVGTNTLNPGKYSVYREKLGPNAFNLWTGVRLFDSSAQFNNRDCLYVRGSPPATGPPITDAVVQRFTGHDTGRAFMSVVDSTGVTVDDFVANNVARHVVNCEPDTSTRQATNVVLRRGTVGHVNFCLFGSKGFPGRPVSATFEDIIQTPGESCANLMWGHANEGGPRSVTFKRVAVFTRGTAEFPNDDTGTSYSTQMFTDVGRFFDQYLKQPLPWSDPMKAVTAWNWQLTLEDVWVNGKPITEADVQWEWTDSQGVAKGTPPTITSTGWVPSNVTSEPPPAPVDPCAELRAEVDRLGTANELLRGVNLSLSTENDALEAKIAAVRAALDG